MIRGRETRACVFFLSLSLPCENTAERQPRESQEDSPHRNSCSTPFQTSSPEMGENTFRLFRQQKQWHVVTAAQATETGRILGQKKLCLASQQKLPDKHDL